MIIGNLIKAYIIKKHIASLINQLNPLRKFEMHVNETINKKTIAEILAIVIRISATVLVISFTHLLINYFRDPFRSLLYINSRIY